MNPSAVRGYRVGVRGGAVAGWLLLGLAFQVAAFEAVRRFFVQTLPGQQLDTIALAGNDIGRGHVVGLVSGVLDTVSVLSVLVATVAIGFIALIRGRVLLSAVATAMIIGANVTTQLLKAVATRPEIGVDLERAAVGNTLPSGHTTVTASVAVALVLVLPAAVRGPAALLGGGVAALTGVATLSAGWHRPSDAVAALLVVGAWAALAGLVLVVARQGDTPEAPGRAHRPSLLALVAVGTALLVLAGVSLALTDQVRHLPPEALSRVRLFVAYAGGAAGIAGAAAAVTAGVLATVHRVVPPQA
jgi:membrane-associated phospholipid phosphatase